MHLFSGEKTKSLVAFFLAVITVVGLIQFNVFAEEYENPYITSGDWTYYCNESADMAVIVSYNGTASSVTVPGKLSGYPVALNMEAMYGCNAKTITISSGVFSIGSHCFADCSNLNKVTIPASVTDLGYAAFSNCKNLVSVTIGSGVTQIPWATFENCSSLTSLSLPSGIQVIGKDAFKNCTSLSAFSFTNQITTIDASAFEGCSKLNSVTLPSSVTTIGDSAFKGCSSLSSISASFGNWSKINIGADILSGTAYYNNTSNWANDCLVFSGCLVSVKQQGEVSIPSGVFAIASGVFAKDYAVKVVLSESVAKICDGAFTNANSLKAIEVSASNNNYFSVEGILIRKSDSALLIYPVGKLEQSCTIPSAIKKISAKAFEGNLYIRNLSLGSVTTIEESAFKGCSSLMSIDFGSAVKTIGDNAFDGCTGLTSVTIPSTATDLGASAFSNCISLERAVVSNNIQIIPINLFYGCSSLKSISIGSSVKSIGQSAFYGCEALEAISIPDNVETIGYYSFGGCKSLKEITACADVDGYAFSDCTALETVTLKEGNGFIADNAFEGCTSLSSVKLPQTLTSIGAYAFLDCTSLKKLTIPSTVTDISSNYAFGYKYVDGEYEKIKSLVVYGYNYSAAEYYCNDNEISFVSLDLPSPGEIILDYSKGIFYLYGEKATPSHVVSYLKESGFSASFTKADGSAIPSGKYIGTGCKVKLGTRNLTVVIKGDTTGDGIVNTSDYIQVKKSFLKTYKFDEWSAIAAEVQENGRIDATDYIRIKLHFLGSLNIFDMAE